MRICFDATIERVDGGYSSAAERLTVAQDVVGSIPTSRPKVPPKKPKQGDGPTLAFRGSFLVTQAETLVPDSAVLPAWLSSFRPHPWLTNGHLQTIVGNFLPRPPFLLPAEAETIEVDPSDGSRVLCHCHWQPEEVRAARLTAVLVHGLNGSSNSRYIRGVAAQAWAAGMNVVRMNMRNCGDTDQLTPTLYHSGQSADVGAVVSHFTKRFRLELRGAGWLLDGR